MTDYQQTDGAREGDGQRFRIERIPTPKQSRPAQEAGLLYAPRGTGMAMRPVDLPCTAPHWTMSGLGEQDQYATDTLKMLVESSLARIAPGVWMVAGPGLVHNGSAPKWGVVQSVEEVPEGKAEVDILLIDTGQPSEDIYDSFFKALWSLFERHMAYQFGASYFKEVNDSILCAHDLLFFVAYERTPAKFREIAWLSFARRFNQMDNFNAAAVEDRIDTDSVHERLFFQALTGSLWRRLSDGRKNLLRS